jgi:hypothetical protein
VGEIEQLLHIVALNSVGKILFRHHVSIQDCHRKKIRQAMVGLFLCTHKLLGAFLAAADDIVCDIEDSDVNLFDLSCRESMFPHHLKDSLDGGLRVDFGRCIS